MCNEGKINMNLKKSKFRLDVIWRYLNQLEKALDRNDRSTVDAVLLNAQNELDVLRDETVAALSEYWDNMSREEAEKEIEEEINACKYFVTLCDKRETVTKAISWTYNAGFETLSSAENYRDSLQLIVDARNSEPQNPRALEVIEGNLVLVISHGPAPKLWYEYYKF
jgi:hypothetical protein